MNEYAKYIPVLKCGNCGVGVEVKDKKCGSCGATLDVEEDTSNFDRFEVQELIMRLNDMVPNGTVIDGKVGIGWAVCNHRMSIGYEPENHLTKQALVKTLSILQMEGCTADLMIVNPIQMYEIMMMEKLIGQVSSGMVGYMFGMAILVSRFQPAGVVLIMDTKQYDERFDEIEEHVMKPDREQRDTLVSLKNGFTSLSSQWMSE